MKIRKIIILAIAIVLLRLIPSCIFRCDCPEIEIVDLTFNHSTITAIDNSSSNILYYLPTDSIAYKAVGFQIELSDSNIINDLDNHDFSHIFKPSTFGFPAANAMEPCMCDDKDYHPIKKLEALKITTRYDISPDYPANCDITELFVGSIDEYTFDTEGLYAPLERILNHYYVIDPMNMPTIEFAIYLKEPVINDKLQLEITFTFDDNSSITDTTSVVHILQNSQR